MSILGAAHRRNVPSGGGSFNRFYLPSTGTPSVSPAYSADWTSTTGAIRTNLVTSKIASAMTTHSTSTPPSICRQYVSAPLAAQTISGTVKGQIRGVRLGNRATAVNAILKVVSNDGSSDLAILRSISAINATYFSGYGCPSPIANIKFDANNTLSSYACSAGDRLVFEVGGKSTASWGSVSYDIQISIGDDSGTDLPENQTETAAYNPWIEFSNAITLQ